MVATPTVPVQPGPDIVRIIGVKPDPEDARNASGASQSSWSPPTAPAGTVTRLSYSQFDDVIGRAASRHRIDPLFLHAVIATESAYRARAVSRAGARGLMQIMPATGRGLGVADPALFDPATNIDAGARHLKRLQRRYGTNFELILSAYNAGEGAVARYGNRVPPYAETRTYVGRVMARYQQLRSGTGPGR
ncbi:MULTISPECIES: lytic transglycosylase domain-containing protein [unclassified Sphingomonas]|jgi:soluble lytic murein transglycosylase-like protein|uniref:lytic transglycosylase domain-containing protein n=1 Tax=unclassified Sphingomonas TaxID=196159 RepID=UPI00082ED3D8|nr:MULTISPECIES: lytic transglycosylase domain-containing protein [unclassified Sphingomonas]